MFVGTPLQGEAAMVADGLQTGWFKREPSQNRKSPGCPELFLQISIM